jgi:aminopeptidase N
LRLETVSKRLETISQLVKTFSSLVETFSSLVKIISSLVEIISSLVKIISSLVKTFSSLVETFSSFVKIISSPSEIVSTRQEMSKTPYHVTNMPIRLSLIMVFAVFSVFSQAPPPIEPGVSQSLAQWRAAQYSDVRYKLNLTLEKMSPVLKGTIEIRVKVGEASSKNSHPYEGGVDAALGGRGGSLLILDWRKIRGYEASSVVSNVTINGQAAVPSANAENHPVGEAPTNLLRKEGSVVYEERSEHLIFRDGVVAGENVIKLDFTSPILTSGSAITRYVDKEDGAEYIYSLFVPSDASTAFPVFDQPDLKARFELSVSVPVKWTVISNSGKADYHDRYPAPVIGSTEIVREVFHFQQTKPISTYVFAFAAGPWERVSVPGAVATGAVSSTASKSPLATASGTDRTGELPMSIYVRKSQASKFKPHAKEVARLTREGVKYLETYFDYKFPWPKYDLVLIPEFPFGGMEHAGATFLRETNIIFPSEPTKGDYISRANVIFHETAHQWFGDTVTMRWFDDLWLKEGFAEFMAYKTLEKVMPEANAWKVFYERNKQAAYATDSTRGTTPIYQPIANLSAAKSAYGNIVYRKAPSFLRQAEFYLSSKYFQAGVRSFLKKYEFSNAGWADLIEEMQKAMNYDKGTGRSLNTWAKNWITKPGVAKIRVQLILNKGDDARSTGPVCRAIEENTPGGDSRIESKFLTLFWKDDKIDPVTCFTSPIGPLNAANLVNGLYQNGLDKEIRYKLILPNYGDFGYGIFLMDGQSRDFVVNNLRLIDDDFVRSMIWGSLWDSVRETEMDPKAYVELAIKQLPVEQDETIVASLLSHVETAMNYYLDDASRERFAPQIEDVLLDRLQHAPAAGQRITFYRAYVRAASTSKGREVLKAMLRQGSAAGIPALRTTDKFDIVTRLIILGDPDATKLLADVEKVEKGDDARRYGFGARAAYGTAENKAKYFSFFVNNASVAESWIEEAMGPFNSVRHADLTRPYLERALAELPNLRRTRKIFFVNNWLHAWIGGQRDESALAIVNKFLAENPKLDNDLRLKILENVDLVERAVKIRKKFSR